MTQPGFPAPHGHPQQPPGQWRPGYPPPGQPPRRSTFRRLLPLWIALGVAALVVVSCSVAVAVSVGKKANDAVQSVASASPGSLFQHPEDVQVTGCQVDPASGFLSATVAIRNGSSKTSSYAVQIAFQSPDKVTRYGDGYAIVNRLGPGQQTTQAVSGLVKPQSAGQQFVCTVVSAQRTAAG